MAGLRHGAQGRNRTTDTVIFSQRRGNTGWYTLLQHAQSKPLYL
jgi:hypothetical protein